MSDILPPLGPPSAAELERETKRAVASAQTTVRALKSKNPVSLCAHVLASLHANLYLLTRAADWRKAKFREIDDRLARLEANGKQLVGYSGVWKEGRHERGALVTHQGGLWVAHDATNDRPGASTAWQLIVKAAKSNGAASRQ